MLKIKDKVNLKKLEKFGFEKTFMYRGGKKVEVYAYRIDDGDIDIYFDNREIVVYEDTKEILFDLIQAGLVEKVAD